MHRRLPPVLLCGLAALLVASGTATAAPPPPPGTTASAATTDPASSAGPPVAARTALTTLFTPPQTELPDGTLTHTPYRRPEWSRVFDPDAPPEYQFRAAPAPDLMVAEPDYGGVDAGMVRVAAGVLGTSPPWQLPKGAARRMIRRAADQAQVLTMLTETEFSRPGLLAAAAELGHPARTLWDLDVGLLSAASADTLDQSLRAWGHPAPDPSRPAQVTRALKRAQKAAGLDANISAPNLTRLSSRTTMARADNASSGGVTVDLGTPETVAGLLQRRDVTLTLPDGAVARGQLLLWHPDDPDVALTADRTTAWGDRATVTDAAARLGAIAAVNGGFWVDESDPDGLLVSGGRTQSDTTAWTGTARGLRGALGLAGTKVLVDRPDWQIQLRRDGQRVGVDALNRPARPGQTVAWNHVGPKPSGEGEQWWLVPEIGKSGPAVRLPGPTRPDANHLVVATNHDLSGRWRTDVAATPGWENLDVGLAGGPRLLRGGEATPSGWWLGEGFAPAHTHQRHPRTAVGVDPYGALVVLVVDGRQPGWSAGTTQAETQAAMQALGVRDATMLDGGGSTQLVVNGRVRNRPCCDSTQRPVATFLGFVPRR